MFIRYGLRAYDEISITLRIPYREVGRKLKPSKLMLMLYHSVFPAILCGMNAICGKNSHLFVLMN